MKCGFIAHYGLVPPDGGFRIAYREPATLIQEFLLAHESHLHVRAEQPAPSEVYADGATDVEIYGQLLRLVSEHADAAARAAEDRRIARELETLLALARGHGLLVVPDHDRPEAQTAPVHGRLFV